MQPVDLYTTYAFIKRLVTPFRQWKAYKLGIINDKGEQLKHRSDLQTMEERNAFGYLDILALNLKKILAKVPGGSTLLGTYAAALMLLKEYPKVQEEDESLFDELPSLVEEALVEAESILMEDGAAPTNSAGGGQIAAIGVGPDGEPPVTQKSKYKKRNEEDTRNMLSGIQAALIRRAKP